MKIFFVVVSEMRIKLISGFLILLFDNDNDIDDENKEKEILIKNVKIKL